MLYSKRELKNDKP